MPDDGGRLFVDSVPVQLEESSDVLMERDEWLLTGRELLFIDSVLSEHPSELGRWIDNEAFRSSSCYKIVKMRIQIHIDGAE